MLRIRLSLFLCMCLLFGGPAARAHRLEPISTAFARPFAPKTGSLQINYAFERRNDARVSTHLIPEAEFELGITRYMQVSVEAPVIHERPDGMRSTTGIGHVEFGARLLVAGGDKKRFAVSLNAFVAPPTGDRSLAGDATEAGAAVHVDREFGERVYFHGNYGWSTTIGGTEDRERAFFYRSAAVIPLTRHWNAVIELLGTTDTASGATEYVAQPEIIYYMNPHWELKLGVPVGLTHASPRIGVRAQVAWIFGKHGTD